MVAVSAGTVVPGVVLTRPEWLAERISDMGISWGTGDTRVSGTLWWCMAASSLIDPVVAAYASGLTAPDMILEHLLCEVRPDGGIERVFPAATSGDSAAGSGSVADHSREDRGSCCAEIDPVGAESVARNLRETLARIIPAVAEVSGAGVAALWAIVADAIGNRAIDAGDAEAGARLAAQVAGRLPVPRFIDIGERTFVRRISCCLVFEVPNCQMCTSCPKRPAAERQELLSALAARG
ncbi:(2Fe-2S)-binding protein [Nocardia jiangxiensis]|uniref:(2Fe-2S)-binding protein n=1 Tax=Nocardia jiangxiensis TaxID=282685 RepID=UPI00030C7353|nr:(2Fe-2S)-binding protein [Nocardia jiangxiensis]